MSWSIRPTVVTINGVDISAHVRRAEWRASYDSIPEFTLTLIGVRCRFGPDGNIILESDGYVAPTELPPDAPRAIRLSDPDGIP